MNSSDSLNISNKFDKNLPVEVFIDYVKILLRVDETFTTTLDLETEGFTEGTFGFFVFAGDMAVENYIVKDYFAGVDAVIIPFDSSELTVVPRGTGVNWGSGGWDSTCDFLTYPKNDEINFTLSKALWGKFVPIDACSFTLSDPNAVFKVLIITRKKRVFDE